MYSLLEQGKHTKALGVTAVQLNDAPRWRRSAPFRRRSLQHTAGVHAHLFEVRVTAINYEAVELEHLLRRVLQEHHQRQRTSKYRAQAMSKRYSARVSEDMQTGPVAGGRVVVLRMYSL